MFRARTSTDSTLLPGLDAASRPLDRRTLLKAGAWAAPVIAVAAAVPAASASNDSPEPPNPTTFDGVTIPTGFGEISGGRLTGRLAVWNDNSGGTPGPIGWNAQIGYWTNIQPADPNAGVLPYIVAVRAAGSTTWTSVQSGAVTVTKYGGYDFPNAFWGTDVMTTGTYTFRLIVVASDGPKLLAEQTVTL